MRILNANPKSSLLVAHGVALGRLWAALVDLTQGLCSPPHLTLLLRSTDPTVPTPRGKATPGGLPERHSEVTIPNNKYHGSAEPERDPIGSVCLSMPQAARSRVLL